MKFRPCIDIHNGKVKQIVGGSLMDQGDFAQDNFVSEKDGDYYATLYKNANLTGGHIILLNPASSEYYAEDVRQACLALSAYPNGLQIGGGMNAENAAFFLEKGASHIIVTSYVFQNGTIHYENLEKIAAVTGKDRLVLDLSCRKKEDGYYVVTDRWQKFTQEKLDLPLLEKLSGYCDEFLIHAVDVEGKANGIEKDIATLIGTWDKCKITYAGGVGSIEDIQTLKTLSKNKADITIGSALDLFGGSLAFTEVLNVIKE